MRYATRVVLARSALIVGAAAALEVGPRLGLASRLEILPLSEMVVGLVMLAKGPLWPHLWASVLSIAISFIASTLLGIVAGYALWRTPAVFERVSPYLVSYYAVPIFAFYPVLVVMFGANRIPIVLIATAWAVVAVIVSTVEGLSNLRHSWEKVAAMYHLGAWQRAWSVHLPGAWPHVATGMRLAVTYSILGVIASEFILSGEGLGYIVNFHYNSFEFREMWGGILVILAVGIGLDTLSRRGTRNWVASR